VLTALGLPIMSLAEEDLSLSSEWPSFVDEKENVTPLKPLESAAAVVEEPVLGSTEETVKVERPAEKVREPQATEPKIAEVKAQEPKQEKSGAETTTWTKSLGSNISLRGTEERLYIKAGDTMVILDQTGRVVIQSAETLNI